VGIVENQCMAPIFAATCPATSWQSMNDGVMA